MNSSARELGRAFEDREVAELYRYRSPYPREIFAIIAGLLIEPRTILDAGCGTGALGRELVLIADRVDALDPSAAMIVEGQRLPHGDHPRLRWTIGRAEDGAVDPPYGLITCGASIHWMDHAVVLPRFRALLAPGARLAIADTESTHPASAMRDDVLEVITRYSPSRDHQETADAVASLDREGRFILEGEKRTAPTPFEQSVDDYIKLCASTSTLSRATLGDRATDFQRDARAVFARHRVARIQYDVVGYVAWGRPT